MNKCQFNVLRTPHWEYEAATLFASNFNNFITDVYMKHNNTKEGKTFLDNTFKRYTSFWETVISETKPFLTEDLWAYYYATPNDKKCCFLTDVMKKLHHKDFCTLTEEDLHSAVMEYIIEYIKSLSSEAAHYTISLQNLEELQKGISDLELDETAKTQILFIYQNYTLIWNEFLRYASQAIPVIQKHFKEIESDYTNGYNALSDGSYLNDMISQSDWIHTLPYHQFTVSISIFEFNYICLLPVEESPGMEVGYLFPLLKNLSNTEEFDQGHISDSLSALSNPIRLQILHYVKEEPKLPYELANLLNLPLPTITQHIEILTKNTLLSIIVKEKNSCEAYYTINQNKIDKICETIKNL